MVADRAQPVAGESNELTGTTGRVQRREDDGAAGAEQTRQRIRRGRVVVDERAVQGYTTAYSSAWFQVTQPYGEVFGMKLRRAPNRSRGG